MFVARGTLSHCTTELRRKPPPITVRFSAEAPWFAESGLIRVTYGRGWQQRQVAKRPPPGMDWQP